MWIPDIYFVNEKSGIKHDLTKENEMLRLWPNGDVFHSMRFVAFSINSYSSSGNGSSSGSESDSGSGSGKVRTVTVVLSAK